MSWRAQTSLPVTTLGAAGLASTALHLALLAGVVAVNPGAPSSPNAREAQLSLAPSTTLSLSNPQFTPPPLPQTAQLTPPPPPEPAPEPAPTPPPAPPSEPVAPPPDEDTVRPGIDDATTDSPNWLGFALATPHAAAPSTVEQSALTPVVGPERPEGVLTPGEGGTLGVSTLQSPPTSPTPPPTPAPTPTPPSQSAGQDPPAPQRNITSQTPPPPAEPISPASTGNPSETTRVLGDERGRAPFATDVSQLPDIAAPAAPPPAVTPVPVTPTPPPAITQPQADQRNSPAPVPPGPDQLTLPVQPLVNIITHTQTRPVVTPLAPGAADTVVPPLADVTSERVPEGLSLPLTNPPVPNISTAPSGSLSPIPAPLAAVPPAPSLTPPLNSSTSVPLASPTALLKPEIPDPLPTGTPAVERNITSPEPKPAAEPFRTLPTEQSPEPESDHKSDQKAEQQAEQTPAQTADESAPNITQGTTPPAPAPPQTPDTQTPASTEVTPASAATGAPGTPGNPGPRGVPRAGLGKGEEAESMSDAAALETAVEIKPGRVLAGKGIQIKTVRPEWAITTRLRASPKNPVVKLTFGKSGRVIRASFVDGHSSGDREVDGPLMDALYRWTAKGTVINNLPSPPPSSPPPLLNTLAQERGVTLSFRVLLNDNEEPTYP